MGTPSEMLAWYRGQDPESIAQREKETAEKRAAALAKAREARKEKAKKRAESRAKWVYCIHPADDPWTIRCRTLCGVVRSADIVVSPKAVARAKVTVCETCKALLAGWKLFHNKPLTSRRLNTWGKDKMGTTGEAKTRDEMVLELALVAINEAKCPGCNGTRVVAGKNGEDEACGECSAWAAKKDMIGDMLIGLIGLEGEERSGVPAVRNLPDGEGGTRVRDRAKIRRALHVELAKLKLPAEVLRALRSA